MLLTRHTLLHFQILLARELRRQGMFFRVDNTMQHGHLINANNFDASRVGTRSA